MNGQDIAPFWQSDDGRLSLYCGDALDVLPRFEPGSVDAVVVDPPYSSGGLHRSDRIVRTSAKYSRTNTQRRYHLFSRDGMDQRAWSHWAMVWLGAAAEICHEGSPLFMFSDWRQLPSASDALQGGGWIWRGIVPWDKTAQARPQKGWFRAQCEYVLTATLGTLGQEQKRTGPCLEGVWIENVRIPEKVHQTQKPVGIYEFLLSVVAADALVCDPFMGSGTAGVACARAGQRFIGIDNEPENCRIARDLIVAELSQPSLYGEANSA